MVNMGGQRLELTCGCCWVCFEKRLYDHQTSMFLGAHHWWNTCQNHTSLNAITITNWTEKDARHGTFLVSAHTINWGRRRLCAFDILFIALGNGQHKKGLLLGIANGFTFGKRVGGLFLICIWTCCPSYCLESSLGEELSIARRRNVVGQYNTSIRKRRMDCITKEEGGRRKDGVSQSCSSCR